MLKGKRGLAKKELAEIILALVVALSIFGPFIKVTDIVASTGEIEKCRLNTVMASIDKGWDMKLFRIDAPNPFYLDCPKRYVHISNDNIKDGKVNTKLAIADKNAERREQQMKELILSEVTKCWKSFGAASDTIYSASTGQGEAGAKTDETACFSCSEILFDKDFEPVTISKSDFYQYANSKSMLVGDKNYVDFLTGGSAPDELPEIFGGKDNITVGGEGNLQWSTVFTIKEMWSAELYDAIKKVFDFARLPPANAGIIDCKIVNKEGGFEKIDGKIANSIGCDGNPPAVNGFVFGKVAKGYYTFFGGQVDWNTGSVLRFPMTVRFVPSSDVFAEGQCERLY